MESKVRIFLRNLENVNTKQYKCLEFRPWPKGYKLKQEQGSIYQVNDTYYFGIRIKQDPSSEDIREKFPQIDLTNERKKFFTKVLTLIENNDKNQTYMEYLNQEKINIDIKYMNRDMLPEFDAEGKRIKPEIKEEKTIPVFDPMQQLP